MTMPLTKSSADRVLEIFNQLADLDIGNVEEAVRLLFRIRGLDSGYPDPMTKVCRADAALIAGYRDEAVESLSYAYQVRATGDLAFLQRLHLLLMLAGERSRSLEIAKILLHTPGIIATEGTTLNLVTNALWLGDIPFLKEIAAIESKADHHHYAQDELELVMEANVEKFLADHQSIINNIIGKYQIAVQSRANDYGDFGASILSTYFFDGTQINRKQLENNLEAALIAYYSQKKLGDVWRGKIMTVLTEAPRHSGADLSRRGTAA